MVVFRMYKLYISICDFIISIIKKTIIWKALINKTQEKQKVIEQFIKFCFVGVSNVIITLACYYLIIAINRKIYIIANTVGYVAGVVNAYYLNSKWVFKMKESSLKIFLKTFVCYLITYFIQTSFLYIAIEVLNWSEILAPIVNIIITTPINFLLNKIVAYKR